MRADEHLTKWLDSEEGQYCLNRRPEPVYLKHVLSIAFSAGWDAACAHFSDIYLNETTKKESP